MKVRFFLFAEASALRAHKFIVGELPHPFAFGLNRAKGIGVIASLAFGTC